jgi:methyl-accepting chemotaxis protein
MIMAKRFEMGIGSKIYAIIALCFIGFIAITAFQTYQVGLNFEQQKEVELRHLGEMALGIIKEEHDAATKSGTPAADAQKRAAARLAAMRYGNNDYFWINDMNMRLVMHPLRAELIGRDMSASKDADGLQLYKAFVDTVKRGGAGFVRYRQLKPGVTDPQPKLSHVVGYAPWGWVVGTGVYIDDLEAQTWAAARMALLLTGVVLLLIAVISIMVARGIANSMHAMTAAMRELAAGKLDVVLPGLGRRDEIGQIAAAVETFKVTATEKAQREADEREVQAHAAAEQKRQADEFVAKERREAEERQEFATKEAMHQLVADFQVTVGTVVDAVASAATKFEASAGTLTTAAEATQDRSNAVAAASEQASANVQSVASSTEELTASVAEISKQAQASSEIAVRAVKQAHDTDDRVTELSQAAARIGDVVKMITAIAEQTNLLALNATIEAARAGEAGRGFAVVASEVKALASQTAKATGDIGDQIASMQAATRDSVKSIKEISDTIGRISEISGAIAAAVEQQGAATREIARNVEEASKGTSEVSVNIVEVSQHASETGAASNEMLTAAKSLSSEGAHLKLEMEQFLHTIRTSVGDRRKFDDPNYSGPERRRERLRAAGRAA